MKRYDYKLSSKELMHEHSTGDWVKYADVKELEAELNESEEYTLKKFNFYDTGYELIEALKRNNELEAEIEKWKEVSLCQGRTLADKIIANVELEAENVRLREALEIHEAHMDIMQRDSERYLMPDDTVFNQDWFVSQMLYHLDGLMQREMQQTAREALAKEEKP
jgi:hypothetical protein